MRRLTKSFVVALAVTVVLTVSIASIALAGNNPETTGNGTELQTCTCSGECVCDGECTENDYFYNYNWSGEKGKGPHQEQYQRKSEPLP